jgi:patched domain-containing protein
MVKDLRDICKTSSLNVTIFHPYFVFFDQFELVRPTSIQCMVIGALIMMVISFIFIPNILCSIWITFSIISIEIGVVGYMSLWEVNLDSISMINLIMCIGFSIDFTAHICYVYMSSKCKYPEDRVREALYSLGLPILQGSVSTILGVVALLLAQSYIFVVFFKMVFLVIFFGAMHGLFLLPVMLSLFGPNSCSKVDDTHSNDDIMFQYKDKKDLNLLHPFAITHPHLMTLASSPNGIYSSKQFTAGSYKVYGNDEKDLGIGTSSEESSENSSSKSQRRKALEDETVKRRYEEGWRKSSQSIYNPSACTFQPNLDVYANKYNEYWNSNENLTKPRSHNEETLYVKRKKIPTNLESSREEKKLQYYKGSNKNQNFSDDMKKIRKQ